MGELKPIAEEAFSRAFDLYELRKQRVEVGRDCIEWWYYYFFFVVFVRGFLLASVWEFNCYTVCYYQVKNNPHPTDFSILYIQNNRVIGHSILQCYLDPISRPGFIQMENSPAMIHVSIGMKWLLCYLFESICVILQRRLIWHMAITCQVSCFIGC